MSANWYIGDEGKVHKPRPYQHELLQYCRNSNAILVLGTGSGKTLISIMLIKELGAVINGRLAEGAKRTIFLANTVPLVEQQAKAIQDQSNFNVGKLTGKMGFESWKEEKRLDYLDKNEVLVVIPEIFKEMLVKRRITFDKINLLIIDECHHTTGDHPLSTIMQLYHEWKNSKVRSRRNKNSLPRILGMTACVVNRKCCAGDEVKKLVINLETAMDGTLVTSKYQDIVKFHTTRPEEIITNFSEYDFNFTSAKVDKAIIKEVTSSLSPILKIDENYSINHFFSKFKKLLQILKTFASRPSDVRILVFVDTRNRAKFLHSLLLSIIEKFPCLQYLKPESIVGSASKEDDLKLNFITDAKHILKKFEEGECNIIFSTKVLEEGIDIQNCNVVIRFDKPKFFSSYIQSLGRARALPSKFILLADQNDSHNVANDIGDFKEISKQLIDVCYAKCLTNPEEIDLSIDDNNVKEVSTNADDSHNSPKALQILKNYCQNLPHDKFFKPSLDISVIEVGNGIKAVLQLPRNSPLKICVAGDVKHKESSAIRAAAKLMCCKLQEIGELNEQGLPAGRQQDCNGKAFNSNVENELQPCSDDGRKVYERRVCKHFKYSSNMNKMYLHCINFSVCSSFLDNKQQLGILCAERIECSKFCIYHELDGRVEVDVQFIQEIFQSNSDFMDKIKHFHKITYQSILNIDDIIVSFNMKEMDHAVLLVPLTSGSIIDIGFLDHLSKFATFEDLTTFHNKMPFCFSADKYVDAVIKPIYENKKDRKDKYFFVDAILTSKNPSSKYSEGESYSDYYMREYQVKIQDTAQPLLQCVPFSKQLINHKLKHTCLINVNNKDHLVLVPEVCLVVPYKQSFFWQIYLVPSLLHRLNGLLLADELFLSIDYFKVLNEVDLDYHHNGLSVYPQMILQALTSVSASDDYNLERIELLGDSFLKFFISVHLFCREKSYHEGKLSTERSNYVSNKTLFSLAKDKDIPEFFQGYVLNPITIIPYGYQIKEDLEVTLRHLKVDPNQWLTYFQNINKYGILPQKIVFHPWKEQLIADKSIADCVEALIGVYFLIGGIKAAHHLLIWLGYEDLRMNHDPPRTAKLNSSTTENDLNSFYGEISFNELEKTLGYNFKDKSFLLEAVTHPSDGRNQITGCYQRLEYLGDAVLDFLITKFIYTKFQDYDPGQLTDLRSHYVNNATLGRLAVDLGLHKYLLHNSLSLKKCIASFIKLIYQGNNEFNTEDDSLEVEDVEVPKALGDMFEAILGAIYIDSDQSLEVCWKVLKNILKDEFIKTEKTTPINDVRVFYETAAKIGCTPRFEYLPAIDEIYECKIMLNDYGIVSGKGKNKRVAKQAAARQAHALLSKRNMTK